MPLVPQRQSGGSCQLSRWGGIPVDARVGPACSAECIAVGRYSAGRRRSQPDDESRAARAGSVGGLLGVDLPAPPLNEPAADREAQPAATRAGGEVRLENAREQVV